MHQQVRKSIDAFPQRGSLALEGSTTWIAVVKHDLGIELYGKCVLGQ